MILALSPLQSDKSTITAELARRGLEMFFMILDLLSFRGRKSKITTEVPDRGSVIAEDQLAMILGLSSPQSDKSTITAEPHA